METKHSVRGRWRDGIAWRLIIGSLLCLSLVGCPQFQRGADEPAGSGSSTSTEVQVGGGIVGTFVTPAQAEPAPVVLMLHGFASKRDEVGDMFKLTAESLAAEGIASLRIDFRGCGASAGDFRATTIDSQVADAERALAWLRESQAIDGQRIGVLGFSLGGAIAILTTSQNLDDIDSMVVWSTVGNLEEDFRELLGEKAFAEARGSGSATRDLGWTTVTLDKPFFDSLSNWDIASGLLGFDGQFLGIAGADDPLSRHVRTLADSINGMAVFVRHANHTFNVLAAEGNQASTVIQATVVHFNGTLKWQTEEEPVEE